MKKRIFTVIMFFAVAAMFFTCTACSVFQGKSAYEIACQNGFSGTEQEWLDSLKGSNGQDGQDGQNGQNGQNAASIDIYTLFEAYAAENDGATFAEFLQQFLMVNYYDTEYAAAKGIQSAISIYSYFTRRITWPGQSSEYSSAGAGVVYRIQDGNAYIITNYHVVYDRDSSASNGIARKIETYSYGYEVSGKGVQAEFVGGSITKDIAVIKAPISGFSSDVKAVEAADSNEVTLGEKAVAVGNPLAEGLSVTSGIISVDSEEITMEALESASKTVTMRVIRTDTPINSGNSGGGLYNARGQLLGIVNAKNKESGVENMGFAIPVNVAAGIADCVIDNAANKCVLGVNVSVSTSGTYYNSSKNRVEITETITVTGVTSGALAYENIFIDDKLVSVRINDGESLLLTRIFHLSDYLYKVRSGDTIYLEIEREGESMTIEMTAGSANFSTV